MAKALLGTFHSDQRTAAHLLSENTRLRVRVRDLEAAHRSTAGRERPPGPGRGCRAARPPARGAQGDAAGLTGDATTATSRVAAGRSACPRRAPRDVGCCGHEVTGRGCRARAARTPFRWLLASSWSTNLGDGIALAAGPLLVASLTDDAFLVSLAATAAVAAAAAVRPAGRRPHRPARPPAHRGRRRPARAAVLVVLVADDRDRPRVDRGRARRAVPARHRRGLRGQHLADAAADARAPRRPGDRQLPAAGRLHHAQPARRPADRAPPCSPPARPGRSSPQAVLVVAGVLLVCRVALPPHGRDRRAQQPPAPRHRRGLPLGACTTPPCAPWC